MCLNKALNLPSDDSVNTLIMVCSQMESRECGYRDIVKFIMQSDRKVGNERRSSVIYHLEHLQRYVYGNMYAIRSIIHKAGTLYSGEVGQVIKLAETILNLLHEEIEITNILCKECQRIRVSEGCCMRLPAGLVISRKDVDEGAPNVDDKGFDYSIIDTPTLNIQQLESNLHDKQRQKYVIVFLANADSDSRATRQIIRNFHAMDVISDDVYFYLPGYEVIEEPVYGDCLSETKSAVDERLKGFYSDFHTKELKSVVIDSPRLGKIFFNSAGFTDFVMEFTKRKKGYHYLGGCEMILMPTDAKKNPNYESASVYDLDAIVDCPKGPSLDAFVFKVFQIIREYKGKGSSPFLSLLGYDVSLRQLKNKVNTLYQEATRHNEYDDKYEIVINNIIIDLNNCLHWDITVENFYFISYSSNNVMQAELLKRILQVHDIHVWIAPDGIPQGREYPVIIPTALKLAKNFVLLLTPDSARSEWVRRELAIAIGNSANTKVKVLLANGFTIQDISRDDELHFLLDRVQIRYSFEDVTQSEEGFNDFIQ